MKVLIIRFSSIGDIVLTTPVIRCLKNQHPEVKVHYLTKSAFWPLLAYNTHIDKLHLLHDDLEVVTEELKQESFDFVIDLHNNLRSARVKKALDVPAKAFPKLNIRKWLLTNLKWQLMPDKSIVERYFEAAAPINVKNDGKGLEYMIPQNIEISNNDIPMSHWGGYVGCVIGGSYATKKLPVAQWQKFCKSIPFPVILLGGPEDRDDGNLIAQQDSVKIYNSCGKFNLNESAQLVKYAKVIVSNDTGLMHIAAAFQKPILSFWGNTSPEMGMFPYYGYNNLTVTVAPKSVIMENKSLGCHPCSKLGYDHCPKKHFKCMRELDMAAAVEHVQSLWHAEK